MDAHIETERLKIAASRGLRLTPDDWKHLEECRQCADVLTEAMRPTTNKAAAEKAA